MQPYKNIRVLVLGASGFIGRCVARHLHQVGANLTVAARNPENLPHEECFYSAQKVELDLLDPEALPYLISENRPEIVFNLAGYGINPAERDSSRAANINAEFLPNLARAMKLLPVIRWQGQRIVHTGSALEYGTCNGDLAENTAPQPTTLYGRTKLAGTLALQESSMRLGVASITARLFTVYGPGERAGRLLPSLLEIARTGGSLDLTAGTQLRDFTYVGDVAEGLLRLGMTRTPPGEVVNLATGRLTSVRHFTEIAAGILGIPASHLHFGALPARDEEMSHKPVAIDKLRNLISWIPATTIQQGIERTLQHENETGIEIT